MALTSRHDDAKKCQFDLSLLPHSFSQHGHLYLGWRLPFNNVDCIFNDLLILKTFCALSFRVYRNKNHVNNNIVLPFPSCAPHATIVTFLVLVVVESIFKEQITPIIVMCF
jgi:hypothetical protein